MFLIDRQGIGPVGGERYEGADGLMRVIEQLEAYHCPLHSGSRQVIFSVPAVYALFSCSMSF